MTVSDLVGASGGTVVTSGTALDREVRGCFVGDLLSLAMSNMKKDDVWITIQTNINIIAVCTLCEVSAVLIAEGMKVDEKVLTKAKEEGITVIESSKSAFELAVMVGNQL